MKEALYRLKQLFTRIDTPVPYRGEHLPEAQMIRVAEQLALQLSDVVHRGRGLNFQRRFRRNARSIRTSYSEFAAQDPENELTASGSEWLLDNFHLVEQTIRNVERDMPRSFYKALPKMAQGKYAGRSRVHLLAEEFLRVSDSALSEQLLSTFVSAFQKNEPLFLSELWAMPAMLRLVLISNLDSLVVSLGRNARLHRTDRRDCSRCF